MTRTCACRCGCHRDIAYRERMQSVARCIRCRKDPTPVCQRPYHAPRQRVRRPTEHRVFEAALPLPATVECAKRIDAQLDRLARERKAKRRQFQVGSAGGQNTAGNHAHGGENVREPSPPLDPMPAVARAFLRMVDET